MAWIMMIMLKSWDLECEFYNLSKGKKDSYLCSLSVKVNYLKEGSKSNPKILYLLH